ncbi:MAG: ribonuclease HI, partial [Proteobacteria bacterium]|nr:ribonuclease HI [Pseudomonadota bacterium]
MSKDLESIVIFTDGACSGNPGPGGWATIVVWPGGDVREFGGGEGDTTNNRMELMATIQGLEAVRSATETIILYTDSTYVIRGITQWVWGWRQRGWQTAEGNPVANRELWEELVRLT